MADRAMAGQSGGGGMTGRQRRTATVGAGLCVVALVIPVVWSLGVSPVDVPFLDGTAWLSSTSEGEIVQVNGQSGRVEASLDVGGAEDIAITQTDGVVVVEIDGEFRTVDMALLDWQGSTSATGEMVVGEDADGSPVVYLVEPSGTIRSLDPLSLDSRGEVEVDGAPGEALVAEGRLYVALDGAAGARIAVIDGDRREAMLEVGDPDDRVHITRLGDEVAVVNQSSATLHRLDAGSPGRQVGDPVDLDLPGGVLQLGPDQPEGRLWVATVREGELLAYDPDTGESVGSVAVGGPRNDLVGPVLLEGIVYVVDRDASVLTLVDAETVTEIRTEDLADYGIEDSADVELFVQAGEVFINDPDSDVAVVYSADGEGRQIDKSETGGAVAMPASEFAADRSGRDEGEDDPTEEAADTDRTGQVEDPAASPSEGPTSGTGDGQNESSPPPDGESGPGPSSPPDEPDGNPPSDPPADPPPTAPPPPSTTTTTSPTTTSTTTTSTTTTSTTTTSTTTTTQPEPDPDPPGAVSLTATAGDGRVDLSWSAAASELPVTYQITSNPAVGGTNSWTTGETSHSLTGLSNGSSYRFTVTPTNDAGNGPGDSETVIPAGAPTLSTPSATSTGDLSFDISASFDLNGGELQSCTVTFDGAAVGNASCSGGTVTASASGDTYATSYPVSVTVQTTTGSANGNATATTGDRSLVVSGETDRLDGACTWDPDMGGTPNTRPYFSGAYHGCPEWDTPPAGYVPSGTTVEATCQTSGDSVRDDYLNTSSTWLSIRGYGYMSTLWFNEYQNNPESGLPGC